MCGSNASDSDISMVVQPPSSRNKTEAKILFFICSKTEVCQASFDCGGHFCKLLNIGFYKESRSVVDDGLIFDGTGIE